MRLLADTNIPAPAVRALRTDGHDVEYVAERVIDPGDAAILLEAVGSGRVLLSKDLDIGALVFRDGAQHGGVLLIEDLGEARAETDMLRSALHEFGPALEAGAFVRVGPSGSRVAHDLS